MDKYRGVSSECVAIDGSFWQEKLACNRRVTIPSIRDRFLETGRFAAFRCDWREGMPNMPHKFWDSDIAKWIEAVAYALFEKPSPELESLVEETIDQIEKNRDRDGYFNSYVLSVVPAHRWQERRDHELYCAGHLIEAAIAWKRTTGKDRFLKLMCEYADYIDRVFREEHTAAFVTTGHEELEIALIRLYEETGHRKYLDLSKWFIDMRGNNELDPVGESWDQLYNQSHAPVRKQTTAEGHAVRAMYLYSAMADIAREYDDADLAEACRTLFDNIALRRMYINGGVGSTSAREAFTKDYDLYNDTAYTETCAQIGLCMFAYRMLKLAPERKYADVFEQVLYNGMLSGGSLDGKAFFYSNPLEIDMRHRIHPSSEEGNWLPRAARQEVFVCSCCPPNYARFVASIGGYLYTESRDRIWIHQYMHNTAWIAGGRLSIRTDYPASGNISIAAEGINGKKLALRIPGWCAAFTLDVPYTMEDGYAVCEGTGAITLALEMKPVLMEANPRVKQDAGKVAVMRGPVLYCMEETDNGECLFDCLIDSEAVFQEVMGIPFPSLETMGWQRESQESPSWLYRPYRNTLKPKKLSLIPYCAFANRGEADMRVWIPVRQ